MGVLELGAAGCLREADRASRGGGGISVFFGDKGRPFCLEGISCLTGDDGLGATVGLLDEADVGFRGAEGFSGLGLIRLWRRVIPVFSWAGCDCGALSEALLVLCATRGSDGCCKREGLVARPSSRTGKRLLLRVTRFSVLVAALEDVLVADVEVVDAGLPVVVVVVVVVVVRTVGEFFFDDDNRRQ